MPATYQLTETKAKEIANRFTHHPPVGDQADRYHEIRSQLKVTAEFISVRCPESRELSLALTHLQEASMWANASIACVE